MEVSRCSSCRRYATNPGILPLVLNAWLAWTYLVFLGSLIAFNAYMLLLARTSSSLAASYSLVNPVVALFLGVTLGGEIVSTWEWLASGVVMVGVVLLLVDQRMSKAPLPPRKRGHERVQLIESLSHPPSIPEATAPSNASLLGNSW